MPNTNPDAAEMTPLGTAVEAARARCEMRIVDVCKAAGISDTTYRLLLRGYKVVGRPPEQQRVPYVPRPETVASVARAVDYDVDEALTLAGYSRLDLDPDLRATLDEPRPVSLSSVPTAELLAELARRCGLSVVIDPANETFQIEQSPEQSSTQTGEAVVNVAPIAFLPPMVPGARAESDHGDEGQGETS